MVPVHAHICWFMILINEMFVSSNELRTLQLIKVYTRGNSTRIMSDTSQHLRKPAKYVCQNNAITTTTIFPVLRLLWPVTGITRLRSSTISKFFLNFFHFC